MEPTVNFENLFQYTPIQHDLIITVLTLGYATMAAGLVYFLTTLKNASPKLRITGVISAVVMISAFLELWVLAQSWDRAFQINLETGMYGLSGTADLFSNSFRYMNWSIDVPMLLTQFLIAIGLTGAYFKKIRALIAGAGLLMIWTGLIGQYYEVANVTTFLIWGTISTVFYVYVLYVLLGVVTKQGPKLPEGARQIALNLRWWVLVTWTLYPIAYLMPVLWEDAWSAVTRQILFTLADITTKVLFGVMLNNLVMIRSAAEDDYEPAKGALRP